MYFMYFCTQLLSRTGLWMFDLGARQIAQETIPEASRGKVNGQWRSMTAFFEMGGYLLALMFSGMSSHLITLILLYS